MNDGSQAVDKYLPQSADGALLEAACNLYVPFSLARGAGRKVWRKMWAKVWSKVWTWARLGCVGGCFSGNSAKVGWFGGGLSPRCCNSNNAADVGHNFERWRRLGFHLAPRDAMLLALDGEKGPADAGKEAKKQRPHQLEPRRLVSTSTRGRRLHDES